MCNYGLNVGLHQFSNLCHLQIHDTYYREIATHNNGDIIMKTLKNLPDLYGSI